MAKLSEKQVKHIASLSKLDLTQEEIEKFQKELSAVIDYFSTLTKLNTEGIEPMAHPTGLTDVLSEDSFQPKQGLATKIATQATDNIYNDYFVVTQLIHKKKQ